MQDPIIWRELALAALAGLIIASLAGLKAWNGWIELQRLRLRADTDQPALGTTSARIELADLRERVRKLEAIAAGVDY